MVGVAAPDAVSVWVRLSGEYEAVLEVSASRHFLNAVASAPARPSRADDDCTAVLRVEGLSPATPYFYRILVNGKPDAYLDIFQTKTAPAGPARFAVAFGSCPRVQRDRVQPIWTSLRLRRRISSSGLGTTFTGTRWTLRPLRRSTVGNGPWRRFRDSLPRCPSWPCGTTMISA